LGFIIIYSDFRRHTKQLKTFIVW